MISMMASPYIDIYPMLWGVIRATNSAGVNTWAFISGGGHIQSAGWTGSMTASTSAVTMPLAPTVIGACMFMPDETYASLGVTNGVRQDAASFSTYRPEGLKVQLSRVATNGGEWGVPNGIGSPGLSVAYNQTSGVATVTHPACDGTNVLIRNVYVTTTNTQFYRVILAAATVNGQACLGVTSTSFEFVRINSSAVIQTGALGTGLKMMAHRPCAVLQDESTVAFGAGSNFWGMVLKETY